MQVATNRIESNIIYWVALQVFTNPIIELGRAAASLGEGHMRTRARRGTFILRDEIADLMDTFNSMAHEIASNQIMLEHKVDQSIYLILLL